MPRYFFDIHDGQDRPDSEGTELPDRQTMRGEAIRLAGEILKDLDGKFSGQEWMTTVRNETGRTLLTLRFSVVES